MFAIGVENGGIVNNRTRTGESREGEIDCVLCTICRITVKRWSLVAWSLEKASVVISVDMLSEVSSARIVPTVPIIGDVKRKYHRRRGRGAWSYLSCGRHRRQTKLLAQVDGGVA